MSANLGYTVDGKIAAIFGMGEAAWHNEGEVVEGLLTTQQIFEKIQLDKMRVAVMPLHDPNGDESGLYGIKRLDTGAWFAACSKGYQTLQNDELFPWADDFVGMANGAHYETAGTLGKGEVVWALARVPHLDFAIGKDESKAFLLFVSSHDGSLATTAKLTYVRVVCANTVATALHGAGKAIKIKHTKNMKERMETALRVFKGAQETAETFQEAFELLANKRFTMEHVSKVLDTIFPKAEKAEGEKAIDTRRTNILDEILALYASNDKNAFPEQAQTGYALLNAITDFVDHQRTVRNTSGNDDANRDVLRAEQAIFGTGAAMKEQALEIILEVAQGAEQAPYRNFIHRAIDKGEAERAEQKPFGLLDLILEGAAN